MTKTSLLTTIKCQNYFQCSVLQETHHIPITLGQHYMPMGDNWRDHNGAPSEV